MLIWPSTKLEKHNLNNCFEDTQEVLTQGGCSYYANVPFSGVQGVITVGTSP